MYICIILVSFYIYCIECKDYCEIYCIGHGSVFGHTLCLFKETGPGKYCQGYWNITLNQSQRELIVDLHNSLRSNVANGKEKSGNPGPQPPASNMRRLLWDDELELMAQRWADQCIDGSDMCRKTDHTTNVGQNIAQITSPEDLNNLEAHIYIWYNEVKYLTPEVITLYRWGETNTYHYTHLVWALTMYVGCGHAIYIRNNTNTSTLVCNYKPQGNSIGLQVYEKGLPCSTCPKNTICKDGLCSEARWNTGLESLVMLFVIGGLLNSIIC